MRHLTANITGNVRREKLNGVDHLVVPLSMIVPGVLNGSKGPLYYSEDEIGKNPAAWNGMPIVLNHPTNDRGLPTSARAPDVLNRFGVGTVFNTTANGKLAAEGWFNIPRLSKVSSLLLNAIKAGQKIELSTGLWTDDEPTEGTFNGKTYSHIARNFRPDHLAVFEDKIGACSVQDGCGVNVNEEKTMKTEEKKAIVNNLIANCSAWDESDRETLDGFTDDKLIALNERNKEFVANEKKRKEAEEKAKKQEATINAAKAGYEDDKIKLSLNEAGEWKREIKSNADDDSKKPEDKPQTINLEDLPESIQADLKFARDVRQQKKISLSLRSRRTPVTRIRTINSMRCR